jgi:hypothetical protein
MLSSASEGRVVTRLGSRVRVSKLNHLGTRSRTPRLEPKGRNDMRDGTSARSPDVLGLQAGPYGYYRFPPIHLYRRISDRRFRILPRHDVPTWTAKADQTINHNNLTAKRGVR